MTSPIGLEIAPETRAELEHASLLHLLALAFQPPVPGLADEIDASASACPAELREPARALAAAALGDREADYHRTLGGAGAIPDCESDYMDNPLGGRGTVIADVAAFYRAFHFDLPAPAPQPDHVSAELDFLSYLLLKAAFARSAGLRDELEICTEGRKRFVAEHVDWIVSFCERVESSGSDYLADSARFASPIVQAMVHATALMGVERLGPRAPHTESEE